MAHQNRGRKPDHAIPEHIKQDIIALYTSKYHGSNNCHFAELLEEHESLCVSPSSVRRIMLENGIKQVKQRRRSKTHAPRKRRSQAGMLWQTDATPYAWLEERAPAFALHAAIDDATGIVVSAVFRPTECREGYSTVMMNGIRKYGIPLGLYSDRHTIFRSPDEKLTIEEELAGETKHLSNFGKAMAELNIEHIKAVTPQAKGRVERLWVTLQDRLVIELRLQGVNTLEEANAVLPKLLDRHNRQFAVEAREAQSAYLQLDSSVNLHHVFAERHQRLMGSGNTLSYKSSVYTLAKPSRFRFQPKMSVEVRETFNGDVLLWHQGEAIALRETVRPTREKQVQQTEATLPHKPPTNHPWRTGWAKRGTQNNIKANTQPPV